MDFDLFVIGAGSGGVRAARMSAQLGARVAVAEVSDLGGTCVNLGCVPKKLFVYAAQFRRGFADAAGFGLAVDAPELDWPTLRDNKNREIKRLNGIYGNLLENAGCTLYRGRATITGPNSVQVNGETITAQRILIATGGWPFVPDIPGREHLITSNEVFHLESWPKRALVIGAGYIAVEFAGIFNGTGVETTLVHRGDQVLRGFDDDVRRFAQTQYEAAGLQLELNTQVSSVEKTSDGFQVTLTNGKRIDTDLVLCATGRVPNTEGLGLQTVDIKTDDRGTILVDDEFQTTADNIYALGDVVGRAELTPVALAEGTYLAHQWFGEGGKPVRYDVIPTAVFSEPNIGTVGLTEEQARREHRITVYESEFRPMQNTLSGNPLRAYMKLIVEQGSERVLGVHMVGPDAGEIMQGFGVAYAMGATKADFDQTIGIHPTSAEEFVTLRTPRKETP
ncbi:MAG: glutathione-disulfide reductase [Natronospirillum sp.]|uniref:glutathione-disulfide reductase n=1 Tax=Natronospirillum sp. TaxID=2812955 RepID=UPI0025EC1566|nr:glutathione-disulfide reductase [Natronospirillum sp.]MCH8551044.1 glutathione-disulfide reductase [Natronospirillum sp.]